nr:MAG TPA: hypothetical protein [Caudoviricetes sp.]
MPQNSQLLSSHKAPRRNFNTKESIKYATN